MTMRLIDAESFNYRLTAIDRLARSDAQAALLGRVFYMLQTQPTIEAEPVRRGAWVPIDDEPHEDFECNACGYISTAAFDCSGITPNAFPYCPMCGAKMEG